jgi:DNA-binding GntR family transcriptional regulator
MREDLTVGDLGDLSDKPLVAVLASLRAEGLVFTVPRRATYVSPDAK